MSPDQVPDRAGAANRAGPPADGGNEEPPVLMRARRTVSGPVVLAWVCAPCFLAYAVACAYLGIQSGPQAISQLNRAIGWLGILPLVTPVLAIGAWRKRLQRHRSGQAQRPPARQHGVRH